MRSPCHQRAQPLAQVGNSVASSPEGSSWLLRPQPDLRHCPSPRQKLPKDHRALNSTGNRRGLPLRVSLPGFPGSQARAAMASGETTKGIAPVKGRTGIPSPHPTPSTRKTASSSASLSGLGKRPPGGRGSSGLPRSSLRPQGLRNTGPRARGRTGLSRQRPLAARAEGGSHSHQVKQWTLSPWDNKRGWESKSEEMGKTTH